MDDSYASFDLYGDENWCLLELPPQDRIRCHALAVMLSLRLLFG